MVARRGRRAPKKSAMKQAKRMVTKQHKAKAKRNMDTFFLKTKDTAVILPQQGGLVANYIYQQFQLDPTGAFAAYIQNAEFNLYRLQYDKFRVNSVKVTFIPKANVLDQAQAQNDAFNTTGDGAIHSCIDRDSIAPSSIAKISRYPSYRKHDIKKTWSRSYSVRYPTGVWIDCQSPATFSMAKELGLTGGITCYAENVLEDNYELWNEPWATVLVETNIVFQGKVSSSLVGQYNEGGQLTGIVVSNDAFVTNLPLTPLRNVRGSLSNDTHYYKTGTSGDLSGVEVAINDQGTTGD